MFYVPGFLALLLIKSGEPTGFGLTIEFLMLASAASVVAGLFIATQSSGHTADAAAKVGTWSGTLHYVVSHAANWLINLAVLALILIGYVANRMGDITLELTAGATLVVLMAITVVYGVLRLKTMQALYDAHRPHKEDKHHAEEAAPPPPA